MFSLFRSKKTESAPVFQTTEAPVPGLIVPGMVFLRAKKWVTVKGRVGIVVSADTSGYVKVHLTNEKGETVEQIRIPVGDVRLARYLEIPEPRRGDKVKAATLGYV
jgi:hypothetical protein